MAYVDEKTGSGEVGEGSGSEGAASHVRHRAKAAHSRKGKAAKAHVAKAAHKGRRERVRHVAPKEVEEKYISVDKLLAAFLVIAVIFGSYMLYVNYKGGGGGGQPTTYTTQPSGGGQPVTQGAKAKLDFYIMSQCPYGVQVLDAIAPVLKKVGGYVDFKANYIASDKGDGTFSSLHGQGEVDEDIRELCAMKYYSDSYKYMDYIVCRNKDIKGTGWESCASGGGMDAAKIKSCAEGDEGKQLLKASISATNKVGATGSPTMFLNGGPYKGGRTESDFMRAICSALSPKPAVCGNMPACSSDADCTAEADKDGFCENPNTAQAKCVYREPVKFNMVAINDKRCADCDTSQVISVSRQLFKGVQVQELDYSDPSAKALMSKYKIKLLPAFIFDQAVEQTSSWKVNTQLKTSFKKEGDRYYLLPPAVGASFDPTAEICDNGIDDDGNGRIDCEDEYCKNQMVCRQEIPKKLDVFVMSQCPYGVQALNAMKEVFDNIKDVSFGIHYIASYDEQSGKFSSLHGQGEVDEDIRELCAMKYYPDSYKYMDYIWCRNKDIRGTGWESCASGSGMDAAKIKACAEGDEGKQLLRDDIKIGQELDIGASPTWLANNKYDFPGITADAIKTGYCQNNPGLPGCEKTLSGATADAAAGGGCG